jgi:hypothetical protein
LWSFTMREIVCLGTKAETVAFLQRARVAVDEFLRLMDLPVEWLTATDSFFQPQSNPKIPATTGAADQARGHLRR